MTRRLLAGPGPSGPPLPGEAPVITGGEGDVVHGALREFAWTANAEASTGTT